MSSAWSTPSSTDMGEGDFLTIAVSSAWSTPSSTDVGVGISFSSMPLEVFECDVSHVWHRRLLDEIQQGWVLPIAIVITVVGTPNDTNMRSYFTVSFEVNNACT